MAAQMLFEVVATASAPSKDAAGQFTYGYPARYVDKHYGDKAVQTLAMGRLPRLRPEVVITTQPPHKHGCAGQGENTGGASSKPAPQEQEPEPQQGSQETSAAKKGKQVERTTEPTHPYTAIPNATYGKIPGSAQPMQ